MAKILHNIFSWGKLQRIFLLLVLSSICWAAVVILIQNQKKLAVTTEENLPNENVLVIYADKNAANIGNMPSMDSVNNDFYVAAVIDYTEEFELDTYGSWKLNMQQHVDIIKECNKYMVDIVVLPEGGLYGYHPMIRNTFLQVAEFIPSAEQFVVPCHHEIYSKGSIQFLSCAAKENSIYVIANVAEKVSSINSLASDGLLLYITEVVFDRTGMLIAKYRKYNLFTERWSYGINSTDKPEVVTFTTDFGVEFGILVCFDLLFNDPAMDLIRKRNITHVVHSSQMITRLPFLPASVIASGWSYALDVTLLTSANACPHYSIGSNIFFGRRSGTRTYVKPFKSSNIIIAPVPKQHHYPAIRYPDQYVSLNKYSAGAKRQRSSLVEHVLKKFTTKPLIVADRKNATFTYKTDIFECNISSSWEHFDFAPNYQFIAYSGLNNHSVASVNNYAEICGIALCSATRYTYCEQPPQFDDASMLVFTSANISVRSIIVDSLRIPTIFDKNFFPLDESYYRFRSYADTYQGKPAIRFEMRLQRPVVNLLGISVYKFFSKVNPIENYSLYSNIMNSDWITYP